MNKCKKAFIVVLLNIAMPLTRSLAVIIVVIAPNILLKETSSQITTNLTQNWNSNFSQNEDLQNSNQSSTLNETLIKQTHSEIMLGVLFGIKGILHVVLSPICGIILDRTFPLIGIFVGATVEVIAVIIYATTNEFPPFIIARSLNALGTTCIICGSMTAISYYFKKTEHRKKINGLSQAIKKISACAAPTLGAVVNQFFGQIAVFTMLLPLYCFVIFSCVPFVLDFYQSKKKIPDTENDESLNIEGTCLAETNIDVTFLPEKDKMKELEISTTFRDDIEINKDENKINTTKEDEEYEIPNGNKATQKQKKTSFYKLLVDPYILISSFGLGVSNSAVFVMYVTIPLYMQHKFQSQQYEQGLVFLPSTVFYLGGTFAAVFVYKRWSTYSYLIIIVFFIINAISTFLMVYIDVWYWLAIPIGINFLTCSMTEYPLMPFLSTLVDKRHTSDYGSVSAIAVSVISLFASAFAFMSAPIFIRFGFFYLITGISCLYLCYAPLFLLTKRYWK